jgi:hypothetical protein
VVFFFFFFYFFAVESLWSSDWEEELDCGVALARNTTPLVKKNATTRSKRRDFLSMTFSPGLAGKRQDLGLPTSSVQAGSRRELRRLPTYICPLGLAVVSAIRPVVVAGSGVDPNGSAGRSRFSSGLGRGLRWNRCVALLRLRTRPRWGGEFDCSPKRRQQNSE